MQTGAHIVRIDQKYWVFPIHNTVWSVVMSPTLLEYTLSVRTQTDFRMRIQIRGNPLREWPITHSALSVESKNLLANGIWV